MKDHKEQHTKRESCPQEARGRVESRLQGRPVPAAISRCAVSGPGHAGKTARQWGPGNFQGKGRETQQKELAPGTLPPVPGPAAREA